MLRWPHQLNLYLAWLGVMIGSFGSLYFSEILAMQPCNLCWYQRICLFPLTVQLPMAIWIADYSMIRYAIPLVSAGGLIAIYQILEQSIPGWALFHLCGMGPSCSEDPLKLFGWITIPMLALAGFTFILIMLLLSRKHFRCI